MVRGSTRVTEAVVILILLLLSVPFATTPIVRAQSGQWVVTMSLQAGLSAGVYTVAVSGSGSAVLNVNDQGQITGTGNFQGSITVTAAAGCSGGGTIPFSETETYSGQIVNSAAGNAAITATASGSSAPSSITLTCPNPSPPPATVSYNVPIPSQMKTAAGTYTITLVDGYTYAYNFPAPMTGSYSFRIRGGITTTASTTSTSQAYGSLSLSVPLGEVQLCDSAHNNCVRVKGGETLRPGQCLITSSSSGVEATNANMDVAIGESSTFCLPPTREEISALCTQSQIYGTIQGQLHVGTFGLSLGQNVYIRTPYMGACDNGTEFTIRTSDTGTTVMVLSDTVLVTDLTSNSTVKLGSGQTITVQSTPSGMGQAAMQQAVKSFDPSSVNKWWLSLGTQTTTSTSSGMQPAEIPAIAYAAVPVVVVLAIAVIALYRTRSRRKVQARRVGPMAAPAGESCPNCGAPLSPSQTFCDNCGARVH